MRMDQTWLPFEDARKFAQTLGLKTRDEWFAWSKSGARPASIPADPRDFYRDSGWLGWGDWLGTGNTHYVRPHLGNEASNKTEGIIGRPSFLPFDAAREFARSSGITTQKEWFAWSKTGHRPQNIPASPNYTYKDEGWLGFGDWLGTGRKRYGHGNQTRKPEAGYRKFQEAREYAQSLQLKNCKEWLAWCKTDARPDNIPSSPSTVYKCDGWISYGDWLGTGRKARTRGREYPPYLEARDYIHGLKLKNHTEWRIWAESADRPADVPSNPEHIYRESGWCNWKDWLGTETTRIRVRDTRPFEEARAFARSLNFGSVTEWDRWALTAERPSDIPTNPNKTYKKSGWLNWADWLGTQRVWKGRYRSFEEARDYVHSLSISGSKEWQAWCKTGARPKDIPSNPYLIYKDEGWAGYPDWLGTAGMDITRPFIQAREFARGLKLRGSKQWFEWAKTTDRPTDIPASPRNAYKDTGWQNWADWLGTSNLRPGSTTFRHFEEARIFARSLCLKGSKSWFDWNRTGARPLDIPAAPYKTYADKGWEGWGDWLCEPVDQSSVIHNQVDKQSRQPQQFRSFVEARNFVHNLRLNSLKEWQDWVRSGSRAKDIPSDPYTFYKDEGWRGYADWLGTSGTKPSYKSFTEARAFTREIGLKSPREWQEWAKSGERPRDIPTNPSMFYKDTGWLGYADWLGYTGSWNKNTIYAFLQTLQPVLGNLTPAELYVIIRQNGLLDSLQYKFGSSQSLMRSLREALQSSDDGSKAAALETIILSDDVGSNAKNDLEEIVNVSTDELKVEAIEVDADSLFGLGISAVDNLKSIDSLVEGGAIRSDDAETIEFLISRKVQWYWEQVLQNKTTVDAIQNTTGGQYFEIIQRRFLTQ